MPEIRFYHLQQTRLEDVLPVILERALERGNRALVLTSSEERAESLSGYLWTYRPDSFLPHGTARDGSADTQPIFLTHRPEENPNRADLLILSENSDHVALSSFTLICDIFDGNDEQSLQDSRQRWKERKAKGFTLVYYQQNEAGKWEEKARG